MILTSLDFGKRVKCFQCKAEYLVGSNGELRSPGTTSSASTPAQPTSTAQGPRPSPMKSATPPMKSATPPMKSPVPPMKSVTPPTGPPESPVGRIGFDKTAGKVPDAEEPRGITLRDADQGTPGFKVKAADERAGPPPALGAQERCPRCGEPRTKGATFCEKCGSTGAIPRPPVRQSADMGKKSGIIAILMLLGVIGLIAVAVFVKRGKGVPSMDDPDLQECLSNLNILGKSLVEYDKDGGRKQGYERLGDLYPYYVDDKRYYRCPKASQDPTAWNDRFSLEEKYTSYACTGLNNIPAAPGHLILVYENGRYHGHGRCVCSANMRCEWIPEKEFRKRLAETEKWIAEHP